MCEEHLFIVGFHIHTKSCQTFWTQTLFHCRITRFWSSSWFHFSPRPMPWIRQTPFLLFSKGRHEFFSKSYDEGDKVLCSTTRCGLHQSAHIAMHKLLKLQNPSCFSFRKRCPLTFTSMQVSHTWWNGTFFKFMPLTIFSNFLRLAMLRWLSFWCQNIVFSFKNFATFALSFRTLMLKRYKFFSPHDSATTTPWTLFTL